MLHRRVIVFEWRIEYLSEKKILLRMTDWGEGTPI